MFDSQIQELDGCVKEHCGRNTLAHMMCTLALKRKIPIANLHIVEFLFGVVVIVVVVVVVVILTNSSLGWLLK